MSEMREGKWDWRGMWNARTEICLKKKSFSKILKEKDKFGELSVEGGNIKMGLIKSVICECVRA
jgi:hypothetical protein